MLEILNIMQITSLVCFILKCDSINNYVMRSWSSPNSVSRIWRRTYPNFSTPINWRNFRDQLTLRAAASPGQVKRFNVALRFGRLWGVTDMSIYVPWIFRCPHTVLSVGVLKVHPLPQVFNGTCLNSWNWRWSTIARRRSSVFSSSMKCKWSLTWSSTRVWDVWSGMFLRRHYRMMLPKRFRRKLRHML